MTVFRSFRNSLQGLIAAYMLFALSTGCSSDQTIAPFIKVNPSFGNANLDVQVTPTETPGVYAIAGEADLPSGTEMTVAAVRYLYPADSTQPATAPPTYSILDYEVVQVSGKQWSTELSLWQVAPDGRFREFWQLDQSRLQLDVKPDSQVVFLATLAPIHNLVPIEQQLQQQGVRLSDRVIQTTSDGKRYLQASQALAVALPTGTTQPPVPRPEDLNDGWGNRYLMLPDPPNPIQLEFPKNRLTNAPVSQQELLY